MGVAVAVVAAVAVAAVDMVGEAVVIAITITATAPTIPTVTTAGPMLTMAAATAMSMNRTLVVGRGRTNSLSSPPIQVRARLLNHRQVPVVNVVDKMEVVLGITTLRFLILLCAQSAVLM
jgi:hypothetical protein